MQEESQKSKIADSEENRGQDEEGQDGVDINHALEEQQEAGLQLRLQQLKQQVNAQRELVEQGALVLTDEMVFPPTFIYLPSK